jgi:hypothetical protein
MHSVFLSYSRRDSTVADSYAAMLEQAGYPIWIDREGIAGGEQWRRAIVAAIEGAKAFIVLLSPQSVQSVNVRKELDLAETARIKILPVAIAQAGIPAEMKYQLAGVQIIEAWARSDGGFPDILRALSGRNAGCAGQPWREAVVGSASRSATGSDVDLSGLGSLDFLARLPFFGRRR